MPTFSIQNFGCRATDADAASLREQLRSKGLALIDQHTAADVVVLNTCTVTAAADSQAREAVRKIHRANPSARIVVSGCYAQRAPEELAVLPGVALVIGNSHFSSIPDVVCDSDSLLPRRAKDFVELSAITEPISLREGSARILAGDIAAQIEFPLPARADSGSDRTRPILKIQDGCNHRCAYCVIPFVRGRSRSLPPDVVIEEVRRLVCSGVKEIVLSGINLGSYGRDLSPRAALEPLVQRILAETEIERVRFSSIEPQDVTRDFIDLVASSNRIAPHFHVPLQSGSDRMLRAMHRWYHAEHYAERILHIRAVLPQAAIGADVIAGFPGESDADFAKTMEFIDSLPFTYLHVFSFSSRPGTEAAKLGSHVNEPEIRRRARALRAFGAAKSAAFRKSQASRSEKALTLHRQGNSWTECLTGNYLPVRIEGVVPANRWYRVRVTERVEDVASESSVCNSDAPEHIRKTVALHASQSA